MADWRFLRGWSEAELEQKHAELERAPVNFDAIDLEPARAIPWRRYFTEAVIGREAIGEPEAGGAYATAWGAIQDYEFSDPSIVKAHFDPARPFQDRTLLLEIRIFGLRYLCGTRITRVEDRHDAERSVRGFRYDTLRGHFEIGSEWFMLTKDHSTGEVRFRIQASWRPGQFPNWWSRIGFYLLGQRFQLAWHRLAYLRLRRITRSDGANLGAIPRGRKLVHAGSELSDPALWNLQAPIPVLGKKPLSEKSE